MIEGLEAQTASGGSNGSGYRDGQSNAAPYATLMGAFAALLFLASGSRHGDRQARIGLADLACLGLASHDLGRIVARDRIAVFLRAPFASGEAAQRPRGAGMQRAIGELLTCPHCLSLWIAAGLAATFVRSPRRARFIASVFAGHAVAEAQGVILERFFRS